MQLIWKTFVERVQALALQCNTAFTIYEKDGFTHIISAEDLSKKEGRHGGRYLAFIDVPTLISEEEARKAIGVKENEPVAFLHEPAGIHHQIDRLVDFTDYRLVHFQDTNEWNGALVYRIHHPETYEDWVRNAYPDWRWFLLEWKDGREGPFVSAILGEYEQEDHERAEKALKRLEETLPKSQAFLSIRKAGNREMARQGSFIDE